MAGTEPAAAPAAVARGGTADLAPAGGSPGGVPLALMDEGLVVSGFGYDRFTALAGQGLGQFWSGLATDPDTAPVMILLGAAVLGAAPGPGRARRDPPSSRVVPQPARVLVEAGLQPAGPQAG